jgi:hypothetical protein
MCSYWPHARELPNPALPIKGLRNQADEGGVLNGSFREATRFQALRLVPVRRLKQELIDSFTTNLQGSKSKCPWVS